VRFNVLVNAVTDVSRVSHVQAVPAVDDETWANISQGWKVRYRPAEAILSFLDKAVPEYFLP
jgi:HEAT repeat protein